jgi:hypothetical protein
MFGLMELGILPTIVLQIEEQWHTYGGVSISVLDKSNRDPTFFS